MKLRSLLARLPIERFRNPPPLVAVVTLGGVIGGVGTLRRGLSLTGLARTLERAFTLHGVDAVALAINSPGGSAVQSALIHKRIRALADEHGVPVVDLVDMFRRIWALGPAGTVIPLTINRSGAERTVDVHSADRNAFLKPPDLH